MNPLVKKELRLLLPAWIGAMALAIVPCWIVQYFEAPTVAANNFPPPLFIMFGMLFLGITSFGNEISFHTFPLLLSQPVPRNRIWQVKVTLLGAAFLSILAASLLSWSLFVSCHPDYSRLFSNAFSGVELWIFVFAFASGGLWATLLLRQTIGAFWVALFAPVAISMVVNVISLPWPISDQCMDTIISVVCVCYAITGFLYAHKLFMQAQDTQWLEGAFTFTWRKSDSEQATGSVSQGRRHWFVTLILKEFQLHQVNILIAIIILVLHLSALFVRKIHPHFQDPYVNGILEMIWTLWLLLPLLIGCSAVAEERKLGILESQLCLPVSRRAQMFVKFFVALVLGLVLGGLMPFLIERIGLSDGLATLVTAAAIFFISFYASSASRTTIQAIGVAIILAVAIYFYEMATMANPFKFENLENFQWGLQLLILYLAVPTLLFALGWLALWNFKWLHPGTLLWRRNIMTIVAALGFTFVLINGIYFRAWELLEPLQPPPGSVRLADPSQVEFSQAAGRLYATLPDGRLWQLWYEVYFSGRSGMRFSIQLNSQGEFIGGSNWMKVAEDEYQEVGIKSDGSLWSLQQKWDTASNRWHQTGPFTVTQIGLDTNWSQAASGSIGFLLLKKDGSLWIWGTNSYPWLWHQAHETLQKLRLDLAMAPTRISDETNWVGLFSTGNSYPYARQNNGNIWHWVGWAGGRANYSHTVVPSATPDNQWSNFTILGDGISFAGVKTNGELWLFKAPDLKRKVGIQLGTHHHWRTVGNGKWDSILAIREDGTLWKWPSIWSTKIPEPVQLGEQADWIALARDSEIEFALAADGNVWAWEAPSDRVWLAPPRRPVNMGNIFQGTSTHL
jgi:ABC-type transport system involved in multi-copper enzyme maturation permease subunit